MTPNELIERLNNLPEMIRNANIEFVLFRDGIGETIIEEGDIIIDDDDDCLQWYFNEVEQ
jgi:hypothetical protein